MSLIDLKLDINTISQMNPFKSRNIAETEEMKALFKELREITGRICLQYAEEQGEKLNIDHVHRSIHAATDFDVIMFKTHAYHQLNSQPNVSLPMSEKIAIAAHESYKRLKEL
ncbi:hypothetical protein PS49_79 [Aeromonas phage PS49]